MTMENDADRAVPSEDLLDALINVVICTPEKRVKERDHGELHISAFPDYTSMREQFSRILSNAPHEPQPPTKTVRTP
jgi:hypothetical protein